MTTTGSAVARRDEPALTPFEVIERVITSGDLNRMTPADRVSFYWRTCESLGLNPLTRPFEFINLNNKLTMYARKDATDQLRRINGVTVSEIRRDKDDDLGLLTVYARGRDKSGREDEATGVVSIKGLSGEALANAVMKAETKAKRRLTLSLVGLGFLDESEVEGAPADVDVTTGEILEPAKPRSLLEAVQAQRDRMEAETAQNGPGADENPDPLTDTADEAVAAAGPDAGAEAPESQGLSNRDLMARAQELGFTGAETVAVAKELFADEGYDPPTSGSLTDEQRARLAGELTARRGL